MWIWIPLPRFSWLLTVVHIWLLSCREFHSSVVGGQPPLDFRMELQQHKLEFNLGTEWGKEKNSSCLYVGTELVAQQFRSGLFFPRLSVPMSWAETENYLLNCTGNFTPKALWHSGKDNKPRVRIPRSKPNKKPLGAVAWLRGDHGNLRVTTVPTNWSSCSGADPFLRSQAACSKATCVHVCEDTENNWMNLPSLQSFLVQSVGASSDVTSFALSALEVIVVTLSHHCNYFWVVGGSRLTGVPGEVNQSATWLSRQTGLYFNLFTLQCSLLFNPSLSCVICRGFSFQ